MSNVFCSSDAAAFVAVVAPDKIDIAALLHTLAAGYIAFELEIVANDIGSVAADTPDRSVRVCFEVKP
jgi:hypothetical protein